VSRRLESRVWVADGLFARRAGVLDLRDGAVRFVGDDGARVFAGDVGETRPRFPWWLRDGVLLSWGGSEHAVLFSDPYLVWPTQEAAAARRRWRDALRPRPRRSPARSRGRPPRPAT
jgi:hypothetical protein